MIPMILGISAYTLLLSSIVSLIFLLRMGVKKNVQSPIYILSTSDTLSSVLTAAILLINQSMMTVESPNDTQNDTHKVTTHELMLRMKNENNEYRQTYAKFYETYNGNISGNDSFNAMPTNCSLHHVLMQYAMFLVPFANAFVSLLTFSMQCSKNVVCIGDKCMKLDEIPKDINKVRRGNEIVGTTGAQVPENVNGEAVNPKREFLTQRNPSESKDKVEETVLKIFRETNIDKFRRNDGKIVGLSVASQWIVPVLLTAILYFSKIQDSREMRRLEEMECIFAVNFPFENCYASSDLNDMDFVSSENEYIGNDYDFRLAVPNSQMTDGIVSKIYEVVEFALNNTRNNSEQVKPVGFYEAFKVWNVTEYADGNYSKNRNSIRFSSTEQIPMQKNKNIEAIQSSKFRSSTTTNPIKDKDEVAIADAELKLFEDAMKKASEEIGLVSSIANVKLKEPDLAMTTNRTHDTNMKTVNTEELSESAKLKDGNDTAFPTINTKITSPENQKHVLTKTTPKSKDQIYEEIIKRIQSVTTNFKLKQKHKMPANNIGDKNMQSTFTPYLLNKQPNEDHIFSFKNGSVLRGAREDNGNGRNGSIDTENMENIMETRFCMKGHCHLSTMFLKIHLLVLLFSIYFIPILLSSILQTRAEYRCRNILEKLKNMTARQENATSGISSDNSENDSIQSSPGIGRNEVKEKLPKVGWFQDENYQRTFDSGECSKSSEGIETLNFEGMENLNFAGTSEKTTRITEGKNESRLEENSGYTSMMEDTKNMKSLFDMLKKSLMLGVLMWTPMFLEVLSKVFLCAKIPEWLVNGLFMIGTSFGIVRNIFNIAMLRIKGSTHNVKENSIRPGT